MPLGQIAGEGMGIVTLDTSKGDSDVFIGNPVQCDRSEMFVTFLVNGKDSKSTVSAADCDFDAKVEVHNPLGEQVEVMLRRTKGFDMVPEFEKEITIPAGTSVSVQLDLKP